MLDRAKQQHWLNGFDIGRDRAVNVLHLFYAEREQVLYLNLTLLIVEAVSSLRINMLKSVIYPVNEVQNIDDLAGIFGWVVVLEHSQPHSWVSHWGPNTRQMEWSHRKLWKEDCFSADAIPFYRWRLTLTNSVLDSIPTYSMSLHLISSKALGRAQ